MEKKEQFWSRLFVAVVTEAVKRTAEDAGVTEIERKRRHQKIYTS